ncbi:MAG TPA: peptidylprolyl isomerase [Methylophilaceae bacterium]|jgi:FKBP-type peptidyl-prolyl cis-trans isomerase FkpA|nr:peptidylprolyl isomerase [Methylophilaceae bacterium]|tara:strand:- start:10407 stop:10856 length:450 start_codon:yes stop_codon:yes gene_type:complete
MLKILLMSLMMLFVISTSYAIEINLEGTKKMEKQITTLVKNDIKLGEGREAEKGLSVTVHYTGWLYDSSSKDGKGKKFDSSVDRQEPFVFILGVGQVIKGWDEGVDGMKVGGHRLITIPSEMGYGSRGAGGVIPANADLIFDVQLLGIQ